MSVDVFDAVMRGYSELEVASNREIIDHFTQIDDSSLAGHLSNIKGIYFEQVYVDRLTQQGIHATIFETTNHPVVDIIVNANDGVVTEFQLKATDSISYINDTLEANPDISIIATTEVASAFNNDMVIDSGISNEALESEVAGTLLEDYVNPISPISIICAFFGIFM